jgi:hypothetical protein
MVATAHDETQLFLYRHPWATTEADNAVELLRELAVEHEALIAERDELQDDLDDALGQLEEVSPDSIRTLTRQLGDLLCFVRRLRDAEKISEVEYEAAKAIAKRIPEHRAQAFTGPSTET